MGQKYTRIPLEFRQKASGRIRQVMKPYTRESSVTAECKEAAASLGLRWMTVWYWYEGYHLPTLYNLVRFADLYRVSLDYLLGRTAVREMAEDIKLARAA